MTQNLLIFPIRGYYCNTAFQTKLGEITLRLGPLETSHLWHQKEIQNEATYNKMLMSNLF